MRLKLPVLECQLNLYSFLLSAMLMMLSPSLSFASSNNLYFDHFSIKEGLSQSSASCVLQDSNGFLWIGTQSGLNRYDGYQFKHYKYSEHPASLSGNWVTACLEDKQGRLWFGTAASGLNRFEPNTESFTHFKHEKDNTNSLRDNRIWSLLEDHQGQLWIGTEAGGVSRLNLARTEFTHFTHDKDKTSSISPGMVRTLHQDKRGRLWLGTYSGLNLFTPKTEDFIHYQHQPANPNSITKGSIWSLADDNQGNLWIGTLTGLDRFNPQKGTFTHFQHDPNKSNSLSHNWVFSLYASNDNKLWIGTYGKGLSVYDLSEGSFTHYKNSETDTNSLSSNYILSMHSDQYGHLWIGTDGGGINRMIPSRSLFNHHQYSKLHPKGLSDNFVRSLLQDSQGQLWVGTRTGGLNRSIPGTKNFEHYQHDPSNSSSLSNKYVFALHEDSQGNIWIGTYGGGLNQFNPKQKNFTRYQHNPKIKNGLTSNYLYVIKSEKNGKLWIGSNKGLDLFDPSDGSVTNYHHQPDKADSLSQNTVISLLYDRQGRLWVGTRGGLNRLDPGAKGFIRYQENSQSKVAISSNIILSLHEDKNGSMWIGTMRGLNHFNTDTQTFTHYNETHGLASDHISGILEDNSGHLWLSTSHGLSKFNIQNKTFKNYLPEDGLQGNSFLPGSAFKSPQGELFFGGSNGFNHFFPQQLKPDPVAPTVILTDFLLFNQSVPIKMPDREYLTKQTQYQLESSISTTKELTLTHNENLFSFEFTGLNLVSPQRNQYAYKLEGFDQQWIYTDYKKRYATYTNIPAGSYQLRVRASNKDGLWTPKEARLKLIILPPPWKSWWAYTLYFIVSSGILLTVIWLIYHRKIAEKDKQAALIIAETKDKLIGNVSHEFRTPLTLILGPLNKLIKNATSINERKSLKLIQRNGYRLLDMVDQMLDLTQLQSNDSIKFKYQELKTVINFIYQSFLPLAEEKNIQITIIDKSQKPLWVYMFPDAVEKLFVNIISNAFKYTQAGGQITITISNANLSSKGIQQAEISIKDTGVGISPKELENIFKRFSRVESSSHHIQGTGIGLTLVKEILSRHDGHITVESKLNVGSEFIIQLPLVENLKSQKLLINEDMQELTTPQTLRSANDDGNEEKDIITANNNLKLKKSLLIIEDNTEMRRYLKSILSQQYDCSCAENGEEGIMITQAQYPDIIVCDVMMPLLDGFAVVEAIRNNMATSHIPILLLSAKNDRESKLHGLNLLADDYLTKPFDEQELLTRVNNLLHIRTLVRRSLTQQVTDSEKSLFETNDALSEKDTLFVNNLQTVMAANYAEVNFSTEDLAQSLHIGVRSLQVKMKALFDLSPMDYLRMYRLQQAKQLLANTDISIGLIAEQVGFNSQSYFSRCFKAINQLSPKQFRQQLENSN